MLEQIIQELDELNDLERLVSICKENITEERRASIHDVRSLFKELESKDCLGIDLLKIVKEILTRTEKPNCLRKWKSLSYDKNVKVSLKGKKVFLPVYLGVKTCKVFLWFLAIIFLGSFDFSVASFYSFFCVTREFHRFLHRG